MCASREFSTVYCPNPLFKIMSKKCTHEMELSGENSSYLYCTNRCGKTANLKQLYEQLIQSKQEIKELKKKLSKSYVKVEPLNEGDVVSFVGCYVTKWGSLMEPTVGFKKLNHDE